MPASLIIADDFLADAWPLREAALKLDYPDLQGAFPGRNSLQRINVDGLAAEASRLTGEPLKPIEPPQSHGKCRITLARDTGRAKVHVDKAYWSGILYLSRPEDCRGGTEFFRHRETGTDRLALTQEEANKHGYASPGEMHDAILSADSLDDAKWDMVMQVPMRFNRLVLLRPWLWHTAGPAFGENIRNGRLVYLMFFASAAN